MIVPINPSDIPDQEIDKTTESMMISAERLDIANDALDDYVAGNYVAVEVMWDNPNITAESLAKAILHRISRYKYCGDSEYFKNIKVCKRRERVFVYDKNWVVL